MWDEEGHLIDRTRPEGSKALQQLLRRPTCHLWLDSPEARARHGQVNRLRRGPFRSQNSTTCHVSPTLGHCHVLWPLLGILCWIEHKMFIKLCNMQTLMYTRYIYHRSGGNPQLKNIVRCDRLSALKCGSRVLMAD